MPTRMTTLYNNTSAALSSDVASQYDNVKIVADNIDGIVAIADAIVTLQLRSWYS